MQKGSEKLQLFVVIFRFIGIILTVKNIETKNGGSYDKESCNFGKWWRCFGI